jgi:hypothetical protein
MTTFFKRLWLPCSERDYWKKPFILLTFSLVLLMLTEYIKAQKEIQINVPDRIAVKSDSIVTYDANQFDRLATAIEGLAGKQQQIIVKNELPKQQVIKSKKKKHKKRWRPAGYY